jgi:hypothetical protein
MTSIIERIFGKTHGISENELDKTISEEKLLENFEIECKEIVGKKKEHREKILAPLVGFLNSGRKRGLICLGLRTEGVQIKSKPGVKQSYIKNEEALRAIIFEKIGSIPKYMKPFDLKITSIPLKDNKNIFLAEIESHDPYCLYYSKVTNNAYERRGDEDKILTLPETFDLVSKRNYAKVFVHIDDLGKTLDKINLGFLWKNEGTDAGRSISTIIKILSPEYLEYRFEPANESTFRLEFQKNKDPIEGINLISSQFHALTGFPPTNLFCYPTLKSIMGNLLISTKNDFFMGIDIINFEEKSKTTQKFELKYMDSEFSFSETLKEFEPYLKL